MHAQAVADALHLDHTYDSWLSALEGVDPVTADLPRGADLHDLLTRLQVTAVDAEEMVEAAPDEGSEPAMLWLLDRVLPFFTPGARTELTMPSLPRELGATARYFYAYVVLAALPHALRSAAGRGIDAQVVWDTFDDLGEKIDVHRRMHGIGGMDRQYWLIRHCRGRLYRLGRLQFDLTRAGPVVGSVPPYHSDEPAIGIHIPERGGSMNPDACDDSLRRMAAFFPRHFPEVQARIATCQSWLLDGQLARYLRADANILHFQRRFAQPPQPQDADADGSVLDFVFRAGPGTDLNDLPQETSLQRAVVGHLRSGAHWYAPTGFIPL